MLVGFSKLLISIEQEDIPDPKWNDRLIQSGLGTIYQAAEIAEHHIHEGRRPFCLKFIDETGKIVGQLLVNEYARFSNGGLKVNILKKIPTLKKMTYGWTYGPIILDRRFAEEIYSTLSKFFLSSKHTIAGWQHPLYTEGIAGLDKNFQLRKWSTFIIDLTKTKDELYNNIEKHSGRKNIERSIERDVLTEEINEKNFVEYAKLRLTQKNLDHHHNELEQRVEWWRSVKKLGYSGLLAKENNVVIGGILFSSFNGHIIEVGVARSEQDTKNKLYSQDLLKWRIIEWGIENNMKYYNLAGFNPNPESEKEKGIYRYKKKWGGKRYDFWRILSK